MMGRIHRGTDTIGCLLTVSAWVAMAIIGIGLCVAIKAILVGVY